MIFKTTGVCFSQFVSWTKENRVLKIWNKRRREGWAKNRFLPIKFESRHKAGTTWVTTLKISNFNEEKIDDRLCNT